jgi:allantoate deiminase
MLPGDHLDILTAEVLARCETVAGFSEEPGRITRPFLCAAMRPLHDCLSGWMRAASMEVRRDPAGNLIGWYAAGRTGAPVFLIGSHLDSVPNAGKYDGVLGVLLGVAAVQALGGRRLPFAMEVLGFSEEEGVRYRTPYLGSRAVCGCFDPALLDRTDAAGITLAEALRHFGLDPAQLPGAAYPRGQVLGYLEAHIEQGPILESLDLPVGVVEAIVGQSRLWVAFAGQAGHAGTLPMEHRRDALPAAAEFVLHVETVARATPGLRATVGALLVEPGAVNVVPGTARLSLDLRHADDAVREQALAALLQRGQDLAAGRGVTFQVEQAEHHAAVPADPRLTEQLAQAVREAGYPPHRLVSGAGHDAAVMAGLAPMAMLFVRSPGGVSHHPDERVHPPDVRTALEVMVRFLSSLSRASQFQPGEPTVRERHSFPGADGSV